MTLVWVLGVRRCVRLPKLIATGTGARTALDRLGVEACVLALLYRAAGPLDTRPSRGSSRRLLSPPRSGSPHGAGSKSRSSAHGCNVSQTEARPPRPLRAGCETVGKLYDADPFAHRLQLVPSRDSAGRRRASDLAPRTSTVSLTAEDRRPPAAPTAPSSGSVAGVRGSRARATSSKPDGRAARPTRRSGADPGHTRPLKQLRSPRPS